MTLHRTGLVCLLATSISACSQPAPRAIGDWHGQMMTPAGEMPLIIHVKSAAPDGGSTLESPEQSPGEQVPIIITAASDDMLAFNVQSLKADYTSIWNARTSQWNGTWQQSGLRLPLDLSPGPGQGVVAGLDGTWETRVVRSTGTFRLILRISTTSDGTLIKFDAPDAGATNLAVTPFTRTGSRVSFSVPASGGHFDGTLSGDGDAMTGVWSFPLQPDTKVTFRRTNRPQQHADTAAVGTSKELTVDNAEAPGVRLSCTLSRPSTPPPYPVVVFATGSGAQDRDETMFGHKPFAAIADSLTERGFATLRCDDRGIARSTGDFALATTYDFASDASAEVDQVATLPDLRHDNIFLLGHSEGGLVSVIAAGRNRRVSGLVLLGTPGTDLRQVLLVQRRQIGEAQGLPADWLLATQPIIEQVFHAVASSHDTRDARDKVRAVLTPDNLARLKLAGPAAELFIQQMSSPWIREFLRLDVQELLSKVRVPAIAIAGSLDRQVDPEANLAALKSGLVASPDVSTQRMDGLNHFLQRAETGAPSEYPSIREDINPAALDALSQWLTRHTIALPQPSTAPVKERK